MTQDKNAGAHRNYVIGDQTSPDFRSNVFRGIFLGPVTVFYGPPPHETVSPSPAMRPPRLLLSRWTLLGLLLNLAASALVGWMIKKWLVPWLLGPSTELTPVEDMVLFLGIFIFICGVQFFLAASERWNSRTDSITLVTEWLADIHGLSQAALKRGWVDALKGLGKLEQELHTLRSRLQHLSLRTVLWSGRCRTLPNLAAGLRGERQEFQKLADMLGPKGESELDVVQSIQALAQAISGLCSGFRTGSL